MNRSRENIHSANDLTRCQAILESALDAFCLVNVQEGQGHPLAVNPAYCQMVGYSCSELLEMQITTAQTEGESPVLTFSHLGHLLQEGSDRWQTALRHRDGTQIQVAVSATYLPDWGCVAAFFRDITEQVHLHTELTRSNRELEQFVYTAAHDLQEPLRKIQSFTRLLAHRYQGQLDERADQYIHFIVDGTQYMQQLIDDVLLYARVGPAPLEVELTALNLILDRVLASLASVIQETGAIVTVETLPTLPVNPIQMEQLFQNLMSNGLKFRRDCPPVLRVSAQQQGDRWQFFVQDNGIGIEPTQWEQIFECFHRLHSQTEYPGTGIGLAICKSIVERHGGQIGLTSEVGQGTTVYFTLPILYANTLKLSREG